MIVHENEREHENLTSLFNALPRADRAKLRLATGLKAMTGIVLEDTKHAPWKFPFYFGYVAAMVVNPVPGLNIIPLGGVFGWYAMGLTPRARWAWGYTQDKFEPVNMINDNAQFVVAACPDGEKPSVRGRHLAWDTHKVMWRDICQSGRICLHRFRPR